IAQYKKDKKSDNYHAQALALTQLKKQEDLIWLKEANIQTLQFALKALDIAFVNLYKHRSEFPRFKSKRHKKTFTVPQSGKREGDHISIQKFKGGIKVKLHREVEGKISKMTISRTPTGNYFVCIFTEQETQQFPKNNKAVGIDLGIKDFVITSDGK